MSEQLAERAPAVAVYMRVSGEDQRRKHTVENQRPDLDRYLAAYSMKPYGWYVDEAVSGAWVPFQERPSGRRLLADAAAGHVDLVLVWRLDRFGRNAYEILGTVRELEKVGARLVSLKEQFDTRTPAGRLMLGILASVAEFEWNSIRERAEAGTLRRFDRPDGAGWMGGHTPYGYVVQGKEEASQLALDETPLGIPAHPNLTPADVVRMIYTLTVEEKLSGTVIAERLNAMGVPTAFSRRDQRYRRGEEDRPALHVWRSDSVTKLMRNPTYKGMRVFGRHPRHNHDRPIVTYPVPAIVSVAVWEQAQTVLQEHRTWHRSQDSRDYLLRSMMTCANCGRYYIGDGGYYNCSGRRHAERKYMDPVATAANRCNAKSVRAAAIEAAIWAKAEWYIHHPDEAHTEVAAQLAEHADEGASIRARLADKQHEQDAKQSERDTILTYYRTGHMTERDLSRQLDAISTEQEKLTRDIARLTADLAIADNTSARLAAADKMLLDLQEQYDAEPLTPERQRLILEQFIDEITVHTRVNPETGKRRAAVRVRWRFEAPEAEARPLESMPKVLPG